MDFTVSSDRASILITMGTIILLAILAIWHVRTRKKYKGKFLFRLRAFFLLILFSIIGYCYLVRPLKYNVTYDRLTIKRLWSDIQIPNHMILDCRQVPASEMAGTVRIFGIGGLFGYFGNYRNNAVGKMKFYGTRFSNFVLIHTLRGESIILTPDKPKEMVDEIMSDITINN